MESISSEQIRKTPSDQKTTYEERCKKCCQPESANPSRNIDNFSGIIDCQLLAKVIECVNFAATKHANQRRKNKAGTPYINHPLGVANILLNEAGVSNSDVILAAILHDTVEDTDTTFEEIENLFGSNVRKIVEEVTDDKTLPKTDRKRLQIENAPTISNGAKLVKLADKLYNLRDLLIETPIGWSLTRTNEYFLWAKAVISGMKGVNYRLDEELDIAFTKYLSNKEKYPEETITTDNKFDVDSEILDI